MFKFAKLNLFFIALLIVTIIPLNLSYLSHVSYDLHLLTSLLTITLIIFFFLIIIFSLISLIFKKLNFYTTIPILISFILFWIFVTGIFFPITGNHDPFFNLSLSINKKYEIIIKSLALIVLFIIIKKKDKKSFFFRFVYLYIFLNFFFLIFNIQKDNFNYADNKLNYFGKKNLIILSFDGISGHKLNEEILDNFELKNNLKDFKFYKNTISGAPYTFASMNIELNGKYEDKNSDGFYRNILNQNNIDTATYNYYDFIIDQKRSISRGEYKKYNNNFKVNKFIQEYIISSFGRWTSPLGVFAAEYLPHTKFYKFFLNLISKNNSEELNPFEKVDTIFHVDLFEYDLIFENIKKDESLDKVIRMYHFSFSHWPVTINQNCEEKKSLNIELKSDVHEKIVLKCVSKKINKFINNLKKNKVYNNSMIIIKSDHAKPNFAERNYSEKFSDFFGKKKYNKHYKKFPLNQKINNSFYWGYGRYKPFILIKNQNEIKNNIEISDKQVFLHDLSKTYCNYFSIDVELKCGYLNRNNLVEDESKFKNYSYDIYIPVHEFTGTVISDLKKYEIQRDVPFYDFFKINKIILSN